MADVTQTITARLVVDLSGWEAGMRQAGKSAEEAAKAAEQAGDAAQKGADKSGTAQDRAATKATQAGRKARQAGQDAAAGAKQAETATNQAGAAQDRLGQKATAAGKAEAAAAKAAAKAQKEAERAARERMDSIDKLSGTALKAGAIAAALPATAIATYADFDAQMSAVQAATHETADNMSALRNEAIKLGSDTAFSATEAAQGVEELAKAGVSTRDILSGGLAGALSLAASGQIDVAEAAETTASTLTQFQLSGDKAVHVADLLAAGAGKAQGGVHDIGLALSYAGVAANGMGVSVEETVGTLAEFASAGIIGEKAGTAFRSMLVSMVKPTAQTQKTLDKFGISFSDAEGHFIGMAGVAGELQDKLGGLDDATRNAALAQIFGNEALGAAQTLYRGGRGDVEKWTDAVNDSGYAAETAAIKQDNLKGDLEKLGGSFESVFIKSGSGANDALRGLVQTAEKVVDIIGNIPGPVLTAGTMIAGLGAAGLLAVGGIGKAYVAMSNFKAAIAGLRGTSAASTIKGVGDMADMAGGQLTGLSTKAGRADRALRALRGAGALALGVLAGYETVRAISSAFIDSAASADQLSQAISHIGKEAFDAKGELEALTNIKPSALMPDMNGIGAAIRAQETNWFGKFTDEASTLFGAFGDSYAEAGLKTIQSYDDALAGLVQAGNLDQAAKGFQDLYGQIDAAGLDGDKAFEYMDGYITSLQEYADTLGVAVDKTAAQEWAFSGVVPEAVAAAQALKDAGQGAQGVADAGPAAASASQDVAAALAEVGVSADGSISDLEAFLDALFDLGRANMSVRDATAAYEEQLDGLAQDKAEQAAGRLSGALNATKTDFDLTSEAGRQLNSDLQGLVSDGMAKAQAMATDGMGQKKIQAALKQTYSDTVTWAKSFGIADDAAATLARTMLGIPDDIKIDTWMSDVAKQMAEQTGAALDEASGDREASITATADTDAAAAELDSTAEDRESTVTQDADTGAAEASLDATAEPRDSQVNAVPGQDSAGPWLLGIADPKSSPFNAVPGSDGVTSWANGLAYTRTITYQAKVLAPKILDYAPKGLFGPGKAHGGRLPGHADGYRLPTTGPGTDRVDGILGVTSDGMPISRVDAGEWIINARSSDTFNGTLAAINRGDRAAALASLVDGYASGGQVGIAQTQHAAAQHQVTQDRARLAALRTQAKTAEREARRAQDAYSDISPDKAHKASRAAAKARSRTADAASKRAQKRVDQAEKALDKSRARVDHLADVISTRKDDVFDLRRDLKRGTIRDSIKSGNGLSVVDQMYSLARSGDLTKGASSRLSARAGSLESILLGMTARADKLTTALDKAKEKRDDLLSARNSVRDAVQGSLDLGTLTGQTDVWGLSVDLTKSTVLSYAKKKASSARKLATKVDELRKKGIPGDLIQQAIDEWTSSGTFEIADALLTMTKGEASQLTKAYNATKSAGTKAGQELTETMYQGGYQAAQGVVKGLTSQQKDVEKAFAKLAKQGESAFKKALGIHSPSRVMAGHGVNVVDGVIKGVQGRSGNLMGAMRDMATQGAAAYAGVPVSASMVRTHTVQAGAGVDYDRLAAAIARAVPAGGGQQVTIQGVGSDRAQELVDALAFQARKTRR